MARLFRFLGVALAGLCFGVVGGCQNNEQVPEELSSYILELSGSAPAFQQEILSDGMVTFSEYDRAMRATRRCLVDRGWDVSEVQPHPADGWSVYFTIEWDYNGDDERERMLSDAADRDFGDCAFLHHEFVEIAYRKSLIPSQEERGALMNELLSCLDDEGVKGVPRSAGIDAFYEAILDQVPPDGGRAILCMDRYLYLFDSLSP